MRGPSNSTLSPSSEPALPSPHQPLPCGTQVKGTLQGGPLPPPHAGFPGKSFWLEEEAREFSEPQKSHHRPSCSGRKPPRVGQHR